MAIDSYFVSTNLFEIFFSKHDQGLHQQCQQSLTAQKCIDVCRNFKSSLSAIKDRYRKKAWHFDCMRFATLGMTLGTATFAGIVMAVGLMSLGIPVLIVGGVSLCLLAFAHGMHKHYSAKKRDARILDAISHKMRHHFEKCRDPKDEKTFDQWFVHFRQDPQRYKEYTNYINEILDCG